MGDIGHNNPPEMIELAKQVTKDLSAWFAEHPTVSSEAEAREVKLQIDRAKLCLKDLEDERDGLVRPLNERVNAINANHRTIRRPLGALLDSMLSALDRFLKAEEDERIRVAMEARRRAQEAEERAREAERIEREKLENAALGEVGIDIAEVTEEADEAFEEYAKAEREAIRAQEATRVKVGGGLGRAIGIRETEVLEVIDASAAITDMGLADGIKVAILTAARSYRRLHNRLPNGIEATIKRHTR